MTDARQQLLLLLTFRQMTADPSALMSDHR
jgi:hypothetical protein